MSSGDGMRYGCRRIGFNCCFECVAPKRHPACHDHCPDRAEEITKNEAAKARARKEHAMDDYVVGGMLRSQRRAGRL